MTRDHGLWDVHGRPDVANVACMKDCAIEVTLASVFPEAAKGAFGDLTSQNRSVGPTRSGLADKVAQGSAAGRPAETAEGLARRSGCLSCHGVDRHVLGPAFKDVAAKYKGDSDAPARLVDKIRRGGSGAWGSIPMPANPALATADAHALVRWVLGL